MEWVVDVLAALVLVLDISIIGAAGLFVFNKLSSGRLDEIRKYVEIKQVIEGYSVHLAFIIALTATLGSLFLSNVLGWAPCRLCWFQRIFMYPLVVVLGSSLFFGSRDARDYSLALALIGAPIALYHYSIQRVDQFHSAGCSVLSVSCSTEYTFHYGYINISMMSLVAFVAIIVLMWKFNNSDEE